MALKFDCLFFVEYFAMDLIMSTSPFVEILDVGTFKEV